MTNEEARNLRPGDKIRITRDMDPTRWCYADSSGIMKSLAGRIFTVATVERGLWGNKPSIQVTEDDGRPGVGHWTWFPSMIEFVESPASPIDVASII